LNAGEEEHGGFFWIAKNNKKDGYDNRCDGCTGCSELH